jgi:hypothetical protein
VRDEVRREETRGRGQIHRGWQRGALEPLWEDVLDSSCPWLANPRKGEVTGPVVTLEHSHRTDQGYLVADAWPSLPAQLPASSGGMRRASNRFVLPPFYTTSAR